MPLHHRDGSLPAWGAFLWRLLGCTFPPAGAKHKVLIVVRCHRAHTTEALARVTVVESLINIVCCLGGFRFPFFKGHPRPCVMSTRMQANNAKARELHWKPLSWLGTFRPTTANDAWDQPLWNTFVCTTLGLEVPVLASLPRRNRGREATTRPPAPHTLSQPKGTTGPSEF